MLLAMLNKNDFSGIENEVRMVTEKWYPGGIISLIDNLPVNTFTYDIQLNENTPKNNQIGRELERMSTLVALIQGYSTVDKLEGSISFCVEKNVLTIVVDLL